MYTVMEKKMASAMLENQVEKNFKNEMDTGIT